jgi:hypothetical protein
MTELKEVFARVLSAPAPPMPSAEEALRTAHRAGRARRLSWVTTATAAMAVAALILVVAVPIMRTGSPTDIGLSASPSESASPSVSPSESVSASPSVPPSNSPTGPTSGPLGGILDGPEYDRARGMLAFLLTQVPAGYTTPTQDLVDTVDPLMGTPQQTAVRLVQVIRESTDQVRYFVGTDVYRDGQGGNISVIVIAGPGAVPVADDPCSVSGPSHQGADEGCHTVIADNGVPVRLSYAARGGGRTDFATVAYGALSVTVSQTHLGGVIGAPPLPGPILTEDQLVALASRPEFKLF